jgi:hypothetical protein
MEEFGREHGVNDEERQPGGSARSP